MEQEVIYWLFPLDGLISLKCLDLLQFNTHTGMAVSLTLKPEHSAPAVRVGAEPLQVTENNMGLFSATVWTPDEMSVCNFCGKVWCISILDAGSEDGVKGQRLDQDKGPLLMTWTSLVCVPSPF